jgi:hypothetical protein
MPESRFALNRKTYEIGASLDLKERPFQKGMADFVGNPS